MPDIRFEAKKYQEHRAKTPRNKYTTKEHYHRREGEIHLIDVQVHEERGKTVSLQKLQFPNKGTHRYER